MKEIEIEIVTTSPSKTRLSKKVKILRAETLADCVKIALTEANVVEYFNYAHSLVVRQNVRNDLLKSYRRKRSED